MQATPRRLSDLWPVYSQIGSDEATRQYHFKASGSESDADIVCKLGLTTHDVLNVVLHTHQGTSFWLVKVRP
jgi:hypothetical protein